VENEAHSSRPRWSRDLRRGSVTAEIACSSPSEGMDIRLLCLLCVVKVEVSAEG